MHKTSSSSSSDLIGATLASRRPRLTRPCHRCREFLFSPGFARETDLIIERDQTRTAFLRCTLADFRSQPTWVDPAVWPCASVGRLGGRARVESNKNSYACDPAGSSFRCSSCVGSESSPDPLGDTRHTIRIRSLALATGCGTPSAGQQFAPVSEKGKPVGRRGRKATGPISRRTAGLPEWISSLGSIVDVWPLRYS